jgi:hypothetical protein
MSMIIDLQNKLQELKNLMDDEQRKLFPFNSVENFFIYYNNLTSDHQAYVQKLLIKYFKVIEDQKFSLMKKLVDTLKLIIF